MLHLTAIGVGLEGSWSAISSPWWHRVGLLALVPGSLWWGCQGLCGERDFGDVLQLSVWKFCSVIFFPIFQFLCVYPRFWQNFEVLFCGMTWLQFQMAHKGGDLAFSLDAVVDTSHAFIASSVLFSLGKKRWSLLTIGKLLEISWQVVPYSQSSMCGWQMVVSSTAHSSLWP